MSGAARATSVSVVIGVLDGEATIARAVDSALAQEFDGDLEVVVVNDGSTDGTQRVLDAFGERITVVVQDNRGLAAARDAGVRVSSGEYVAFLDADDVWEPGKLSATVPLLRDPGCVLVYSALYHFTPAGGRFATEAPATEHRTPSLEDLLCRVWPILPSTVVLRRSVFDRVGGFAEAFVDYGGEDCWLWLRMREHGPFAFVPERLVGRQIVPAGEGERFWGGFSTFERLVRARYGRRARALLREIRRQQSNSAVRCGLQALRARDRGRAMRELVRAMRIDPRNPRTAVRLGWSVLPFDVARRIGAHLPPGVAWRLGVSSTDDALSRRPAPGTP